MSMLLRATQHTIISTLRFKITTSQFRVMGHFIALGGGSDGHCLIIVCKRRAIVLPLRPHVENQSPLFVQM